MSDRVLVIRIDGRPPGGNDRIPWQVRARERRVWRQTAHMVAVDAIREWESKHPGVVWSPLERADVSVAFGVPDKRRRDLDNLIASAKALLDGIVDAGVLVDDSTDVITRMEFGAVMNGRTETVIVATNAAPEREEAPGQSDAERVPLSSTDR